MRYFGRYALAFVAVLAFAVTAKASTVNELIYQDSTTVNTASDESAEYVALSGADTSGSYLNRAVTPATVTNGDGTKTTTVTISKGDILRGAIDMNTLTNSVTGSSDVGASGNDAWQAVFSTKIVDIVDVDGNGTLDLVLGADPDFGNWLSELHTTYGQTDSTVSNPLVSGTVARFFTESLGAGNDADFTSSGGTADSHVATATDGTFYWDLGFGSANDLWVAFDAVTTVPLVDHDFITSSGFSLSNANFTLSLMQNGAGVGIVQHAVGPNPLGLATSTLVDFSGSVSVRGVGSSYAAGFHATDNAQFDFVAAPTPSAVWLGLAMMGLLGVGRSRRRKSA